MRKTTQLLIAATMGLFVTMQGCSKKEMSVPKQTGQPESKVKETNGLGTALNQANVPDDVYAISSFSGLSPLKVMGAINFSALDYAQQEQKPYAENKGQDWILKKVNATDYIIIHRHSNKALTVAYGQAVENQPLILWPYNPSANSQRWRIQWAGGYSVYQIKSVINTNMGIHLASNSSADGIKFTLKTYGGSGTHDFQGYMAIQPVIYTVNTALFVGLPDTQSYAKSDTNIPAFQEQVDYLLANKASVTMAIQHGDITDNNTAGNWARIQPRMIQLNNEVPYALTTGNHDMSTNGTASDRNTANFNTNFPFNTMKSLPCFGGLYADPNGANKMDNSYYLVETGQYKWLVLNLEFGPRDIVLTWAKSICDQFPDRTVILNTHSFTHFNDTRVTTGYTWNPHNYPLNSLGATEVNDGQEMWDDLVKITPNIRFVLSGHVLGDGCGTLMSTNNAGNNVYQMLTNFQDGVTDAIGRGGDGYLRKYIFNFSTGVHTVETRKAVNNSIYTDNPPTQDHNFTMTGAQLVTPLDEALTTF